MFSRFPESAYLAAPVVAALCTAAAVPAWCTWCQANGVVDDPGGRKDHAQTTALAGGLAMLTGLLLSVAMALIALQSGWIPAHVLDVLEYGFFRRGIPLAAILAGAVAMTGLGFWDDYKELRPSLKFAGQVVIAGMVAACGVRITLFVPSLAFSYLVTLLWILTLTNAVNFLDNMNGLCGGLGVVAAGCFAAHGIRHGHYLVALLALLVCGALVGFLPYNFPKARVFLGDAGSHLVGYLLAILAILPHFHSEKNPSKLAVISPVLILAIPLIDIVSVVFIRTRAGKPFWIGDHNHVSHRLTRRGFSRVQAVSILWGIALMFGLITFLL